MEEDFSDLQRLLRLKRHEAPPPDFLEDFLLEFRQRQRAELLKRPLWRLALDRLEGALPTFQFQRYAYAGSFAAVLAVAGVSAKQFLTTPATTSSAQAGQVTVQTDVVRVMADRPTSTIAQSVAVEQTDDQPPMRFKAPAYAYTAQPGRLSIYSQRPTVSLAEVDFEHPRPRAASATVVRNPRYVLDAQPVSYEQPESF